MDGNVSQNVRFDVMRIEKELKTVLVIARARIVEAIVDRVVAVVQLNFVRVEVLTRIRSVLEQVIIVIEETNRTNVGQH